MEKKKAVIYARYSSSSQREESIESQLRICHDYAEANDLLVVKEYTDSALSGRTDQRPDFQRMIQDSARGIFDVLLIYAYDRFSRNKYDAATYKAKLKKNGVKIIAVTLPLDDSPESGLIETVMEGFAQYYSENLSRSIRRGLEENAIHCKSNGNIPLGYKRGEDGSWDVDPVGSKAVRIIFEMYADGSKKQDIAKVLNDAGYQTVQGKIFKINSFRTILENDAYLGIYKHSGYRNVGGVPAIIDQELFDRVQEQVARNRKARGRMKADEEYLLSGKIYCGLCGAPMIGESGTSKTGRTYRYYICTKHKRQKACHKKQERKQVLEDTVIQYIKDQILTDELVELIAEREIELLEEESADKALLASLEKQYKEVSTKLENLMNAIEAGIFTAKTKERLLDLEAQQSDLEDKIVKEKLKKPEFTKDHVIFWLERFRDGSVDDEDFKKAIVNNLINAVYVYDETQKGNGGRIAIALNITNRPTKALKSSAVTKLVDQDTQKTNFSILKKIALFWFRR